LGFGVGDGVGHRCVCRLLEYCSRSGGTCCQEQGVEFMEFVGHSRGEGRASLAAVSGKVEGLSNGRVGHLMMLAPWDDSCPCL
jgi:hypothetical protein